MTDTVQRRAFVNVLINTLIANVTTSFLWFALTFWVYIETQSVLATGREERTGDRFGLGRERERLG